MTKVELMASDESIVETFEEHAIELTLPELDMVGGGGMGSVLV
jgi:hypothetical protein